jgi:hypothetical protein
MLVYILTLLFLFIAVIWIILKSRNMHLWILTYIKQSFTKKHPKNHKHVYFCLADHYEPYFGSAEQDVARARVKRWVDGYKSVVSGHTDSNGRHPQHTYFYPEEEYDEWVLNELKSLCDSGLGDVEIHLHHDNDTADNLTQTLNGFKELLHDKHHLLRKNKEGEIVYGFIHGNWALDNSRPDGRWCGIDNEIDVLIDTGCAYDMTMPSAPSDTQTSTINSIYFAEEDGCAKSHNTGRRATTNSVSASDRELLMIQGALALNWKSRKFGIIPRIESSELSYDAPPTKYRAKLWFDASVCVKGAEDHVFIKLHTHGLQDQNMDMFFDEKGFNNLWSSLESLYKDVDNCSLHYVTAWEMYEKAEQLIGKDLD